MNWKRQLIDAAREVIRTEKALRGNRQSWLSSPPPPIETPEGATYDRQRKESHKAVSEFWMLTDVEYDEKDLIREACWNWRYWKVMARKCCWYQLRTGNTEWAGATMQQLHAAEFRLMKLLGLENEYKSPGAYIEEQFPNLKQKAS